MQKTEVQYPGADIVIFQPAPFQPGKYQTFIVHFLEVLIDMMDNDE